MVGSDEEVVQMGLNRGVRRNDRVWGVSVCNADRVFIALEFVADSRVWAAALV